MNNLTRYLLTCALAALLCTAGAALASDNAPHTTSMFQGPKANTGTAIHTVENGKSILRVSADFKVPDTPAPTWRVIDTNGNIYTLDAFKIKGGEKREVVVPSYVPNVAKVQVYCAWAQIVLGEAGFSMAVK
jgi:hypothetical protein